jgi:hypothetical protein
MAMSMQLRGGTRPEGHVLVVTTVLRGLTAAAVLLSASVHLQLWAEGFKDLHVIGPLFLLTAVGGLGIALAVLLWPHWLPVLAAAGFGASTLTAFWLSATVGLFGFKEVVLTGAPQLLAEGAEIAAIVLGLSAAVLSVARRG